MCVYSIFLTSIPMRWPKSQSVGLKRLSNIVWKRHLFLRFLFRTYENIASNHKKGTFFALLIGTFLNRKKGTFFALLKRSLQTEKKVPFLRLKVLFGKVRNGWKADNIDNKIFSPESLKYPPIFSKKVPFFNFSPDRLALTKKVTILHVVLWKMNAES